MKKKILAFLLALTVIAASLAAVFSAFADDVTWRFDSSSKTLYIGGSGAMEDYNSPYETPWSTYLLLIEKLVVEDGVTALGNNAFSGASALTSVDLSSGVSAIGSGTFSSCAALTELTLSENVVSIGDVSFAKIGADDKADFTLNTVAGSYALFYAINNGIPFDCASVGCGDYTVHIPQNTGMRAYYPYTAKVNGTFAFYSVSKYDPLGYVYDENMNLLVENDDYDTKYNSEMDSCDFAVTVNLEKGKTYYFAAAVFNPRMKADYGVTLAAIDYYVSGGIYLMENPQGDTGDVQLTECTLNGQPTNGVYSLHITSPDTTVCLEANGVTWYHTVSADNGETYNIPFMGCDLNGDRIVNAKDYAMMLKTHYPYIEYFEPFLNYQY